MKYKKIVTATFLDRPNRFIAEVELKGRRETVHVKNTGRCKELLIAGATVRLERSENPARKTAYDLVGVEKQREGLPPLSVNMDSQAANTIAEEWLRKHTEGTVRREVTYGSSRFDFYVEGQHRRAFLEVKGVTLEREGVAYFPDAPTERGVKHVRELQKALAEGYEAYILFVIQMKGVRCFRPNDETHKAFGDALREAAAAGVGIYAVDCTVTHDTVTADRLIPVEL